MSRAETSLRKVSQDWAFACNTKHLDDVVGLYGTDAMVMRSNVPPIRGTAAIREFFFAALDAGLGEVEFEPLRVELFGDFGFEAGRCKMLVPSPGGKRREERGKYLIISQKQEGEWKIIADSWSTDLSLNTTVDAGQKPPVPPSLPPRPLRK
jgi:ketosteroid isomerase-like protein